jgi:hypothetical protein
MTFRSPRRRISESRRVAFARRTMRQSAQPAGATASAFGSSSATNQSDDPIHHRRPASRGASVGLDPGKFATLRTLVWVKSCPSDDVGSTCGVPRIVAKVWRSASIVTRFKPPRLEPREGSLGGALTSLEGALTFERRARSLAMKSALRSRNRHQMTARPAGRARICAAARRVRSRHGDSDQFELPERHGIILLKTAPPPSPPRGRAAADNVSE